MKTIQSVLFAVSVFFFSTLAQAVHAADSPSRIVNINSATAEQIAVTLDGVGMSKAMAIIEHRKRYGSFKHVDSLESVKGIGKSTVEKNRTKIKIN